MKTRFGKGILCAAWILLILLLTPQKALAVSASFSGNSTVKAGDSVVLTLSVSGNIHGLSGTLSTGSGLTFTNYDCADSHLSLTVNGNNFAAYGTTAVTGRIITVTLRVDSSLPAGTALTASFENITVSDGESDSDLGTASWSGTVAAKPSSECHLTDIRCANATLSPAFSKDTTYYTANVPYSVSKLSLDYDRADKNGSSVAISDTSLAVGANTITLKVTAADGTTKVYTLSVTRQQDPNYKAGTDATLKELTLDAGTLSPAFRKDCTDYVAYVPYETREATLSGVANDEKAVTSGEKTVKLEKEGATDVAILCTAEDGKTTQTYTVHVFRMPAYSGILPTVEVREDAEAALATETVAEPEAAMLDIPKNISLPLIGSAPTLLVCGITLLVVLALLFLLGLLIGREQGETYEDEDERRPLQPEEPLLERLQKQSLSQPVISAQEEIEDVPMSDAIAEEPPAGETRPAEEEAPASQPENELRAAEKAAENMSLDELLSDIRDM